MLCGGCGEIRENYFHVPFLSTSEPAAKLRLKFSAIHFACNAILYFGAQFHSSVARREM